MGDVLCMGAYTGTNVTAGADPGHTHTAVSITEADPLAVHVDGSTPLTANWPVGGFNVTGVGTLAATTVTGANVTAGANPGHTHTGASLSNIDHGADCTGASLLDDDHTQYVLNANEATNITGGTFDLTTTGTITTTTNLYMGQYLYHYGDANTLIQFPAADRIDFEAGGKSMLEFDAILGTAVINEDGHDRDWRIESATNTYGLFLQGSDGKYGINTGLLEARLHVYNGDCLQAPVANTVLFVENSGDSLISIGCGTANEGGIYIAENGSSVTGYWIFDTGENSNFMNLEVHAGGTNDVRFDSATSEVFALASSRRYKEAIHKFKMTEEMKLKYLSIPTFDYLAKGDKNKIPQRGFMAEDTFEILPELTVMEWVDTDKTLPGSVRKIRKKSGRVDGVKHDWFPVMNHAVLKDHDKEIKKLYTIIERLESRIKELERGH